MGAAKRGPKPVDVAGIDRRALQHRDTFITSPPEPVTVEERDQSRAQTAAPALVTLITNSRGEPLSKRIDLVDGHLKKKPAAELVEGHAERVAIASLSQLAELIEGLTSDQALSHGVSEKPSARIVTKKMLATGAYPDAIARDLQHFRWHDGSGVSMLDFDRLTGGAPWLSHEVDELLCRALPWWPMAARLYRPSVSAFVYDEAGNELSGTGSLRCYALVDKATNIPFLGVAIADALWKAGHGRIEFSGAGSMLVRCPVDTAVWSPERLDFAGPAVLGAGLIQKRPEPRQIAGGIIDSEAALANGPGKLSVADWQRQSAEVQAAKRKARPEETRRRKAYVAKRVREDVEAGRSEAEAKAQWSRAVEHHNLGSDFGIILQGGAPITVGAMLADAETFHDERCGDPLGESDDPRIAYINLKPESGPPYIYSHAHGGIKYDLAAQPESMEAKKGKRSKKADAEEGEEKKSQTAVLVELAQRADLFHTADGAAWADIEIGGRRETWPVKSRGFRRWLKHLVYAEIGRVPNSEAWANATSMIDALATIRGDQRSVYMRVAEHEGRIYLDLADEKWRVVEIDAAGWRIILRPPVRFRRTSGMLPLPDPVEGGNIQNLRRFLNVKTDDDFVLAVAWLLGALAPDGPYPVLVATGEQGTAKSTFTALVRSLTDPNDTPLRSMPREDRDLFIAANNSLVVAFDNISGLPGWLSDGLCRLATGGGFACRTLHENDEETRFSAKRPIVLNGIEDVATRGDLADRALMLSLEPIPETERKRERSLWAEFRKAQPGILGALLSAVSRGIQRLPSTELERLPRMADFAIWATACETAFWPDGTFMRAYTANRAEAVNVVLDADAVALALRSLMDIQQRWTGTASDLHEALSGVVTETVKRGREWPGSARALGGQLKRLGPPLRKVGITIERVRGGGRANARLLVIKQHAAGGDAKHTDDFASETSDRPKDGESRCSATVFASDANDDDNQRLASEDSHFASEGYGMNGSAGTSDEARTQAKMGLRPKKTLKVNVSDDEDVSDDASPSSLADGAADVWGRAL